MLDALPPALHAQAVQSLAQVAKYQQDSPSFTTHLVWQVAPEATMDSHPFPRVIYAHLLAKHAHQHLSPVASAASQTMYFYQVPALLPVPTATTLTI